MESFTKERQDITIQGQKCSVECTAKDKSFKLVMTRYAENELEIDYDEMASSVKGFELFNNMEEFAAFVMHRIKENSFTCEFGENNLVKLILHIDAGSIKLKMPLILKPKSQAMLDVLMNEQKKYIKELQTQLEEAKQKKAMQMIDVIIFNLNNSVNSSSISTYYSSFQNFSGATGALKLEGKAYVKWDFIVSCLYGGNTYIYKFRIMVKNNTVNSTTYWPNESGAGSYINSGYYDNFSMSDLVELQKGEYTLTLQWNFSGNSSSYPVYWYPGYGGECKLFARINYL